MFTTRMPVVRRVDMANVIIDVLCPDGRDTEHRRSKLIEISVKPGEKNLRRVDARRRDLAGAGGQVLFCSVAGLQDPLFGEIS